LVAASAPATFVVASMTATAAASTMGEAPDGVEVDRASNLGRRTLRTVAPALEKVKPCNRVETTTVTRLLCQRDT
jgi:hypothetical protein